MTLFVIYNLQTRFYYHFKALPEDIQRVLLIAARYGSADLKSDMRAIIGRDWIMVPTRRGLVQVACNETRALRL